MNQNSQNASHSYALPRRLQVLILGALFIIVLVAGLVLGMNGMIFGHGQAVAEPVPPKLSRFVPAKQQLAALDIERVGLHLFRTEIITDGYIAPNGGFSAPGAVGRVQEGSPILAGQSNDVLQAQSDLATAMGQYRLADSNERRQHALYRADGAALKDWQQAEADLATAAASLATARNRLRMLGKSDREIAEFERAQARIAQGKAVFAVGDSATVWLIANVREEDAPKVHLGDEIDVRVPAFPDRVFKGKLDYMASLIDPATHRLVVGAAIPNPQGALRANMSANVTIVAGPAAVAPAVPAKAVVYEGGTARVWVAGNDGSLSLRDITLGRTNGDLLEVKDGLASGERIVTSGALFIDRAASGE
ncbi:MAG: efflux RND transporter periplasmic adaptor subunit [Rhizomicrobium sp.]